MFAAACLIGPHRDDLEIRFRERNLRSFGSSGQQRSALITLDLAAISVYHSKHQEYPIFLIDDVDAELDGIRIERLLEYLDGRTQTFVTTSKRNHFERFISAGGFLRSERRKSDCGNRAHGSDDEGRKCHLMRLINRITEMKVMKIWQHLHQN